MSPAVVTTVEEALVNEARVHLRKQVLLTDRHFIDGTRVGLEEEARGETVPLDELRRKYGRK